MKIKYLISILMALAVLSPSVLGAYPVLEFYVTDQMDVLSFGEVDAIEQLCKNVYVEKSPEMMVLIVNNTEPESISQYTANTLEVNNLGQEGKENALLLVISISENDWWIEIESGLSGFLTSRKVKDITDEFLVPHLAEGDYYSGIYETVGALGQEILENYVDPTIEDTSNRPIKGLICTTGQLVIGVVIALFAVLLFTHLVKNKDKVYEWSKERDEKASKGKKGPEDTNKEKKRRLR